MSTTVQPMSGHFLWSTKDVNGNFEETHVANLFTDYGLVPKKPLLILIARYIDPVTLQEIDQSGSKIGHFIGGHDNYYVAAFGNPPTRIDYAYWDNPVTSQTRTTVYELRGFGIETSRTGVRVNSFPSANLWTGGLVTNAEWLWALDVWAVQY